MNITIENKLIREKRDMNVYHHATGSAHMISHNSFVTLPLRPVIEADYLYVSIVGGPGGLEGNYVVNLPSWVDFEFFSKGDVIVTHSGDRTLVKIPPGFPMWQLKMTRSLSSLAKSSDCVIIGDDYTASYDEGRQNWP